MASVKNHKIRSMRSSHTKAPFYMFAGKAQNTLEQRIQHGIMPKKGQNILEQMSDEDLAKFVD